MARRAKRVKLSKAQQLENELNKQLAKRDLSIAMLVKAMTKLKQLERSVVRMRKKATVPEVEKLPRFKRIKVETKDLDKAIDKVAQSSRAMDHEAKMEALGFHKIKRRRKTDAAAPSA